MSGRNNWVWALSLVRLEGGSIFRSTSPLQQRCRRGAELLWGQAGRERNLGRVVGDGGRQAQPEKLPEGDGLKDGAGTAVEVTNSVEPFDGQGQLLYSYDKATRIFYNGIHITFLQELRQIEAKEKHGRGCPSMFAEICCEGAQTCP